MKRGQRATHVKHAPNGQPLKKFLQKLFGSLGLRIIVLGLNLATAVVLARVLGPEEYGVYTFALAIMAIVGVPGQAGMPLLAVREVAFYQVDKNWRLLRGFLIRQRQWVLAYSAIALTIGAATMALFPELGDRNAIIWALLLLPCYTLIIVTGASIRGMQRVFLGQIVETALRPFFLLLGLGAALAIAGLGAFSAAHVMAWHAAAALVALGFGFWAQKKVTARSVATAVPDYESQRWLSSLLPLTLFGAINIINAKFDLVMLRVMVDASEVAYYQVALQLAVGVLFAHQAILMVAGPRIARLWREQDLIKTQELLVWSARSSFFSALPMALAMILAGPWIIELLFGKDYAPAYIALSVLCAGRVVASSFGVIVQLMKLTNWEGLMVRLLLFGTVSNVALNLLLIPRFGAAGAAAAAIVASVAWKTLAVREAHRRMGLLSFVVAYNPPQSKAGRQS